MSIPTPPGVFDIIPNDAREAWRSSHYWSYIEEIVRQTAKDFGYQEIRTPIFERAELFQRGVGETSDIVSKEMYLFEDKGGRQMSLRPEGTAPVMRAFVENQLQNQGTVHKLFYIGPMFRYDRPQAGRYRQHHQFGVEAIAPSVPEQDAEVIDLLYTIYKRLGLKHLNIYLNCLGTNECRIAYRKALQDYLQPHMEGLSEDSKKRFSANPLRILDSKDPKDLEIVSNAPSILDFLSSESRDYFQAVRSLLDSLGIPYQVKPSLVRGLDYYNQTVFEIASGELGAQNSIGGGGRYDGLLKILGGPDLPSMGFGAGIERLIQTMIKQGIEVPKPTVPKLFLIPLGETAKNYVFKLTHELREKGLSVQMEFADRKLGKSMQYANQIGAAYAAVIGDQELEAEEIELKDMQSGTTHKISLKSLGKLLKLEEQGQNYVSLSEEMEKPFANSQEAKYFIDKVNQAVADTQKATDDLYDKVRNMKDWLEKE